MRLVQFILVFCVLIVAGALQAAENPRITSARIGGTAANTRFVMDATQKLSFSANAEADNRIVLILPKVTFDPSTAQAIDNVKKKLLIDNITRRNTGDVTQVVLTLTKPAKVMQAFTIPAKDGKPPRLVVDLALVEKSSTTVTEITETTTIISGKGTTKTETKSKTVTKVAPKKTQKIIVIDPGHGGIDPGATGTDGVREKTITLAAAKELQKQMQKNPNYKVILTRDRDIFIPLKERRDIARRKQADLFISLHADIVGSGDGSVRGASIYTISDEASDAESAKLAARENLSDAIAGIDIGKQDDAEVAGILIDLAMRETMNQSKRFATTLAGNFGKSKVRLLDKPLRAAGFAVLKAPDVPSVLIEMGFLSSPDETTLLQSAQHRAKLAKAISSGVNDYFDYLERQRD